MSKEELLQIEELPDLKVAWHESYKLCQKKNCFR